MLRPCLNSRLSLLRWPGRTFCGVAAGLLVAAAGLLWPSADSFAQANVGDRIANSIDLGNRDLVTLPPGNWELLVKTTSQGSGSPWEAWLLKNLESEAAVPFLAIHTYRKSTRWSRLDCTDRPGVGSQFLSNDHGATYPGTDRCSRSWIVANFRTWLESPSAWWKSLAPALLAANAQAGPIILSELRVQVFFGAGIIVTPFIKAPAKVTPVAFREAGRSSNLSADHQMLAQWNALYLAAIEQSFINGKQAPIVALTLPSYGSTQGPVTVAVAPAPLREPPGTAPAMAGQPTGGLREPPGAEASPARPSSGQLREPPGAEAPSARPSNGQLREPPAATAQAPATPPVTPQVLPSSVADEQRRLDTERAALAEQMEKMRELLAQLQKANADAAQATNQRLASQTPPAGPKAATVFANRRALIVGNDRYSSVTPLENAVADANSMSAALTSAGFKVSLHLNLEEKRFKQVLRDFRQQVEGGDEVLFFFAGHGVQIGNVNYLLPVDIQGQNEEQIRDEAIPLQRILDDMQDRKVKFTLAVIDACRDNPFKGTGRSLGGRGLAPTTAATGQMIMFSAGSGQQALDRLGPQDKEKNGLFTRVFVKEMLVPGIPVDRVLRNVRNEVVKLAKSVGHEQTPALYDQAIGEFFFRQ